MKPSAHALGAMLVPKILPTLLALSAAIGSMSACAQANTALAAAPAPLSRAEAVSKKVTNATNRAGVKVVNAVKRADGGKPGAAVARVGEKIADKLPQTAAYKKKNKGKKAKPAPEAG